ncbi:hypothetical protein ACLB2K_046268 [Fragaria x ananassa]
MPARGASTPADSNSFPDLFPSPASPPNSSFPAKLTLFEVLGDLARKLEFGGLAGDGKWSGKLLESAGVEARPRWRRAEVSPFATVRHRRGRASTLADSSSFPNLFPSPASPPNSSFPARSPKTSNKVNLAGKLDRNSTDSPGMERGWGSCWSPMGWRRTLAGAVRCRTEGNLHRKAVQTLPPASTHPGNECTRPPPALDQTRNHPDSPLASSARTAASNPLPCTTPAASAPSLLRPWTRPPPASTCVVWAEVDRTHLGWITPLAWVSLLIF